MLKQYQYDQDKNLTGLFVQSGNAILANNHYDAEGLRHEMEENGSLVQFIFNQDREVIAEQNSLGITRYIRSSELIARNTDAARTYYHYVSDEIGSTTHIVDEDGIVLNHYDYDAWGNITAQEEAVPNRFKFTGQQLDPVTQQYYLRARFYNPVIARFTQEDTYRGDGLNLYAYCANRPTYYIDPTGHEKNNAWGTDKKARRTYTDGNGQSFVQDTKGYWHDNSGQFCQDPTKSNQPSVPQATTPSAKLTTKEIGSRGEEIARKMLRQNGWEILIDIKNNSNNGIDIVARSSDGRLGFFEVKSTNGGTIGTLSKRQSDMDYFIRDVLSNAANKSKNYKGISDTTSQAARNILIEYNAQPWEATGSVIGVDISTGEVFISRWNR